MCYVNWRKLTADGLERMVDLVGKFLLVFVA